MKEFDPPDPRHADPIREPEVRRQTRRSFLTGVLAAIVGVSGWRWLATRREDLGISWPFRRILDWNGDLSQEFFSGERTSAGVGTPALGKETRLNGDLGLRSMLELGRWKLRVPPSEPDDEATEIGLDELKDLPQRQEVIRLACIEGWSIPVLCEGVRFSDFLEAYDFGKDSDTGDYFPYVGLETPDRRYYVSLDMASMLHPETLLCLKMNGYPLSPQHGAPLRLITPVKYGIKNLKRVGTIFFARNRPPDYWQERGYDWYSGL